MTVTLASVTTDEGVPTSTVDLEIPEATMEAMDAATEAGDDAKIWRSVEHTSELQSLMRISYAVICLNKKQKKYQKHPLIRNSNYYTLQKQSIHDTEHDN